MVDRGVQQMKNGDAAIKMPDSPASNQLENDEKEIMGSLFVVMDAGKE